MNSENYWIKSSRSIKQNHLFASRLLRFFVNFAPLINYVYEESEDHHPQNDAQ